MIVTFAFSILLYLLLFVITFLVEAILHFSDLSTEMVSGFLKAYFLDGLGIFLAISPIIAFVSRIKKGYWLALVFAEIYTFAGMFTSMSNVLKPLYPITAVFNLSGYYTATTGYWIGSIIILLLCGGLSAFIILKALPYSEKD